RGDRGGDQTILAKLADDEGLQIEQPHTHKKHRDHKRRQNLSGDAITKERKNGETKNREVRRSAHCRQRHSRHHRILTAEHFRATRENRAPNCLPSEVLNSEVKRVGESEQRKHRRENVDLSHFPALRSSFWITTRSFSAGRFSKFTSRPFMNTVGVPFTPIECPRLPSCMIRFATASPSTSFLNRSTSMPISFAYPSKIGRTSNCFDHSFW